MSTEFLPGLASPVLGRSVPMDPDAAHGLALRLKALADPVRLKLLDHLLVCPSQEDCTCNLAPLVQLSEPTVSHHLKKLQRCGFLTKERRGMSVYYRVSPRAIDAVAGALRVG
ncbi:helix-turn-helix transcriptional regulator [Cyanobium sp. ATX 6A2]|nr:helix-turn-helix transcriptional regulator [Cyanobium sp. ATX 6A2]